MRKKFAEERCRFDERTTRAYWYVCNQEGRGVSRAEIATELNLKKSQYVTQIMEKLVGLGWLSKRYEEITYPPKFLYYANTQQELPGMEGE